VEHAFPSLGAGLAHSILLNSQFGTPLRFFRAGPPQSLSESTGKHPSLVHMFVPWDHCYNPEIKFSTAKSRSPARSPQWQWRQGQDVARYGASEDCSLLSTQDELVESKDRSRTLELSVLSFSCPNLMHEFEFEVRISDQIQTVKMAVG
jgi:hypothetical protein